MTSQDITLNTFSFLKWFAVVSFLSIATTTILSTVVISRFLETHLLRREATVGMEFIQSVARINNPGPYFSGTTDQRDLQQLEEFMGHIISLPEVLGAHIYAPDGRIVWSTNSSLEGRMMALNEELEAALAGNLMIERAGAEDIEAAWDDGEYPAQKFDPNAEFIETYIPVMHSDGKRVIGAVELYEKPDALFDTLRQAKWLILAISAMTGLFLYALLFWLVRHGKKVFLRQQEALIESEKLAAVGNMAESIAHSIRNPIASIRSSAELAMDDATAESYGCLEDIISEVDRFDRWIRDLLTYSASPDPRVGQASIAQALRKSIASFGDRPRRQNITIQVSVPAGLPPVSGNEKLLVQVFNSLISNSLEAMPDGGSISISAQRSGDRVMLDLADTGEGMEAEMVSLVFKPMQSRKKGGLGMGLPLVKRTLQGLKGDIQLESNKGRGTVAHIDLPVSAATA